MKAYTSQNADNRIKQALEREGFEVEALMGYEALTHPVDTHADMLLLCVGDTVFAPQNYEIPASLSASHKVVKIEENISARYPFDVALNVAIVGKNVFCNEKYASKTVLNHLKENGYTVHHIAQGYAHCSSCIVNDNALISADSTIVQAAQKTGVDALQIRHGHISLPPYEYGFIGGSCGSTESTVYFCGSLSHHPDGENIRAFIERHGKQVVELTKEALCDVGGILFLD